MGRELTCGIRSGGGGGDRIGKAVDLRGSGFECEGEEGVGGGCELEAEKGGVIGAGECAREVR